MPPTAIHIVATYAMNAPGASPELRAYLRTGAAAVRESGRRAGAIVELIDSLPPVPEPAALAARADAVIVLGGADVDPALYGQAVASPSVQAIHPAADAFEIELIRASMAAGRPLLGICRGMQLLNVACGGTLVQDLGAASGHSRGVAGDCLDHGVRLTAGSHVEQAFGSDRFTVRSDHHQAIAALGRGLAVTGRAEDGVIEAIEHRDGWSLGVQWHPEDPGAAPGELDGLIRTLVARVAMPVPLATARGGGSRRLVGRSASRA